MPWNELHITTTAEIANELGEILTELGAQAVSFQDAADQPIFEPSPESMQLWQSTVVIGLFDEKQPIDPIIQFVKNHLFDQEKLSFFVKNIPDENWERRCLESFKPLQFGKRLWICPSWHTPPDPNAVNIILDPGLAFGTGTHPTTGLCLKWLDENITGQENLVIDYGCGSGILAIAALKLGAKKALAVDNDPEALIATRTNAERNHIDFNRLITLLASDIDQWKEKSDVLIANILAQPLIELAPRFELLIKNWRKIVLSGILSGHVKEVISAYTPGFELKEPVYHEEWVRLDGIKT